MPEPVAAPRGEAADDERGALGHVGLAPVGRPEVHRRGVVEQEPGRQLAVRHVLADVRGERPGGGVPVDLADVVARLVRPDAVELEAVAAADAAVVAGHPATDATVQRQLELADQPVGDGARPRPGRRSGSGRRPWPGRPRRSCGRLHRDLEARGRDEGQDAADDGVRGDALGQRRSSS